MAGSAWSLAAVLLPVLVAAACQAAYWVLFWRSNKQVRI
jgi:hypothetical protein